MEIFLTTNSLFCPFCWTAEFHADYDNEWHSILCGNCFARGPLAKTKEEAVEAWNDRSRVKTESYLTKD